MPDKTLKEKVIEATRQPQQDESTRFNSPRKGFGSLAPHLWKLGTPTTDSDYQKRYNEASGPTEKGKVLIEYDNHYPDLFHKSAWVKTALADNPHFQGTIAGTKKASPWYESSPDVLRRRQIVLKNPNLSAASLCKVFDLDSITLPNEWKRKYNVTSWSDAYKNPKAKPLIQKMVASDKTKG